MNPIFWADEKLITKVAEPIAWRTQYRWGKDNFDLAEIANDISAVSFAVANITLAITSREPVLGIVGSYAIWTLWREFRDTIRICATQIRASPQALNFRKAGFIRPLRILLFWVLLPFFGSLLGFAGGNASTWGLVAVFVIGQLMQGYFTSCNPMPPNWQAPKEEKLPDALPQLG